MSAAPDYHADWRGQPPAADLAALLAAAGGAVGELADGLDLGPMADRDAAAVMGTLTTLVGQLDGLRVRVTREVRDREICGLRGARTLAGWLRADARLADDAWKLARLAAMTPGLPRIAALLGAGTISLTQAATACWQISQLPHLPVPPDTIDPPGPADAPGPGTPGGAGGAGAPDTGPGAGGGAPDLAPCDGDSPCHGDGSCHGDGPCDGDGAPGSDPETGPRDGDRDPGAPGCDPQTSRREGNGEAGSDAEHGQDTGAGPAGPGPAGAGSSGAEPPGDGGRGGGDEWAGLWRAGDVHAAADELFAAFLPGLDAGQLRQMGAHLREAADSQDHAADARGDYARRGLRISRSLGGAGEISGRLHAEAAEQVIAAFEELGARTGPDDKRSKAQRWADALARLTATTPDLQPAPAPDLQPAPPGPAPAAPAPDPDDDQPCDGDSPSGHDHHAAGPDAATRDHHSHGHRPDTRHDGHDPDTRHDGHDPDTQHDGHDPDARRDGHDPGTRQDDHGQGPDPDAGPDQHRDSHDNDTRPGGPAGSVPAAYRRPRVIVTVPLTTLLGQPLAPGATLGSGTPLTAEAARRLACDAEIIRLITAPPDTSDSGHDGDASTRLTRLMAAAIAQLPPPLATPSAVLDIGRKSPGWTPRQRDALYAQYGGHCSAPRCGGPIDVIHHIVHWLYGGKTRTINGAPFCLYHHWLVHEGGWRASKLRDQTITLYPPPPGWRPGTIYRRGKPLTE